MLSVETVSGNKAEMAAGGSHSRKGSSSVKHEPTPGVLRTSMSPPIMRASDCDISSPRPEPPNWRATLLSTW